MEAPRTIVLGDVHGMLPELDALLHELQLSRRDCLVSCGDLLDRGPDSPGVVRRLRELREEGYDVVLVKGNHEERHERFRRASSRPGRVKMHGVEELEAITSGLTDADIAFLDTAVMVHRLPEHGSVVVHGGVLPTMTSLNAPDPADKRAVRKYSLILRVRHVTGAPRERRGKLRPAGAFVNLGEDTPEDPFWAEVYDGRFGHLYFGHQPFVDATEPVRFAHATGLDLGACFGGRLAAAILVEGEEPRFISVAAHAKYATTLEEDQAAAAARSSPR